MSDWSRIYDLTLTVAAVFYCAFALTSEIEGGLLAALFYLQLERIHARLHAWGPG